MTTPGRWVDYYTEDFARFWQARSRDEDRSVLMLVGLGFDPRCLVSLQRLGRSLGPRKAGLLGLRVKAPVTSGASGPLVRELEARNDRALATLLSGFQSEGTIDVATHDREGHSVVGRATLLAMKDAGPILRRYTDVVVDISGMPRGMFFPLIAYLLRLVHKGEFRNLHLAIVEDPDLDARISGREYGQAEYVNTFRPAKDTRLVWLPVIGGSAVSKLDKIYAKIAASCIEICPVLPFPARSLRAVDDIAVAHQEVLFESLQVSPDNILLCDERTPFDVYRKILEVDDYYRRSLSALPALGEARVVVSPLSSKTLSVGVLLAAIDRGLAVCHVEPGTYVVTPDSAGSLSLTDGVEPTEVWIAGEPYES